MKISDHAATSSSPRPTTRCCTRIEAESGRMLWSAQLGERTGFARGVASNSFAVFVTNANMFHALDKKTGRPIWRHNLGTIPTSSPACDEDLAMVGLTSGKIVALNLKTKDEQGKRNDPDHADSRPGTGTPADRCPPGLCRPSTFVVFGSADGKAYVGRWPVERTPLFRIPTGGPIGEGLGTFGTRTLLIPSADNNLYAVDLFTAKVFWTFPSGAPIEQEPLGRRSGYLHRQHRGQPELCSTRRPASPRWTELDPGRAARRDQREQGLPSLATTSICSSWIARRAGCWWTPVRLTSAPG